MSMQPQKRQQTKITDGGCNMVVDQKFGQLLLAVLGNRWLMAYAVMTARKIFASLLHLRKRFPSVHHRIDLNLLNSHSFRFFP